jgi:hypothetical protein
MLDQKFTEAIIDAWNADQSHPHRGRAQRELPPKEVISRFLDEAFLATVREEEGRPIKFSVAVMQQQEVKSLISPTMHRPVCFAAEIPFSAATLAKIAPAFDPVLTTIVVRWEKDSGALFIWGIWMHAPASNRFMEIPVSGPGTANFRPDSFTLISKGRAALAVTRGSSLIGTFQAGYFSPATPTPFTSTSLGQYVYASVQSDPIYAAVGMPYWHYVRDALDVLLSEASLRGHGGTVVLLSPGVDPAESAYVSRYRVSGSFNLQSTLRDCIEKERSIEISAAYRKVANETLQRIAQLAAVDGALILTFAFEVLAFGATLKAPRTDAVLVTGPDGFGRGAGRPFDISRYGTRHRSAMDFAAAIPESIVFVISQDGPIRAFRRADDKTIQVWPDCTASMFV